MFLSEERRTQLLSYLVHAGEILQNDNHLPKRHYRYAYLPTGSELYTGVLKAAGYLFLDKRLENIIIIVQQSTSPKEIIGYQDSDKEKLLIRGHTIENNSKEYTKTQENISQEIFEQLLYSTLTNQIKKVTILGVGTKVSKKNIKEKIESIKYSEYGIIMLGKASEKHNNASKKEDTIMMEHILNKKPYKENLTRLGNTYIDTIKNHKGKPELVAYIHSSDLGIKTTQQIGYICAVA